MSQSMNETDPTRRAADGPPRYFGRALARLRESYSQRIAKTDTSGVFLRAEPTAKALVECLRACGYSISPATYSEIENGQVLPRDAGSFVDAVAKCLYLDEQDTHELLQRLAYDILYSRLGAGYAENIIGSSEWR